MGKLSRSWLHTNIEMTSSYWLSNSSYASHRSFYDIHWSEVAFVDFDLGCVTSTLPIPQSWTLKNTLCNNVPSLYLCHRHLRRSGNQEYPRLTLGQKRPSPWAGLPKTDDDHHAIHRCWTSQFDIHLNYRCVSDWFQDFSQMFRPIFVIVRQEQVFLVTIKTLSDQPNVRIIVTGKSLGISIRKTSKLSYLRCSGCFWLGNWDGQAWLFPWNLLPWNHRRWIGQI